MNINISNLRGNYKVLLASDGHGTKLIHEVVVTEDNDVTSKFCVLQLDEWKSRHDSLASAVVNFNFASGAREAIGDIGA